MLSTLLGLLLIILFKFNHLKNINCKKKLCDMVEIVGFVYSATRKAMKLSREAL